MRELKRLVLCLTISICNFVYYEVLTSLLRWERDLVPPNPYYQLKLKYYQPTKVGSSSTRAGLSRVPKYHILNIGA